MSIDALSGEVSLFLLYVNKFQNRLHRMDATKHTLPTIQKSLSCKKFSMTTTFTPSKPSYNRCFFFFKLLNFVLAARLARSLSLSPSFNAGPVVDISCPGELQITKGGLSCHSKGETLVNGRENAPLLRMRSKTSVSQRDERQTGGTLWLHGNS